MREFQEKLEQLMELAAKQEQNLNNEQILEIFGLNQLSPQQLQSLYEYLRIQGIRIQGADLAPMDIGKALDPQEEQEEEKKPVILEAEDEQCLKEYEEMLRQFPSEKEGEREALLLQAVTDVAGVQERLAQLYLKEILQYARKLWRQGIYIGDLIQEGNKRKVQICGRVFCRWEENLWSISLYLRIFCPKNRKECVSALKSGRKFFRMEKPSWNIPAP